MNEEDKQNGFSGAEKGKRESKVRELWAVLHKMGFMNDEKYNRLTSNEKLTDDQLAGFIERQLVETAQGAKGIADLLKSLMPGTEIVYVKARNVSDFRKEYKMLKSRLINDYHHAQDAYLNIVVGNVYFTKFSRNPLNYAEEGSAGVTAKITIIIFYKNVR
ncbi:MAG: type II CRISPR RNA-guided endonuclease Cas9 [Blautia faecis]